MHRLILGSAGLILLVLGWVVFGSATSPEGSFYASAAPAERGALQTAQQKPIVEEAHEFMEHVNGPMFERLKRMLAQEPRKSALWRQLQGYALVLGESGNLLMLRPPDQDTAADWNRFCVALREQGAKLYEATKKRNFQSSRQHYVGLAQQCNACHKEFTGGEPVIEP